MQNDAFFIKASNRRLDDFGALLAMDYRIDIGRWFSQGWDIFKANAAGAIGFAVIAALCYGAVNYILPGAGLLVQYPLLAGFIIASLMFTGGGRPELKHYFWGFRHLLPLLAFTVVSTVFIFVGFLLLIAPGVYLAVAYQFAPFLIVDKNLDFWPAMELSRKKAQQHWFGLFGLMAALTVLNIVCVMPTVGISLFLTLPLSMHITTAAYRDIFADTTAAEHQLSWE